jgi:hypothetical protein
MPTEVGGLLKLREFLALSPLLALLLFGLVACAGLGMPGSSPTAQGGRIIVVTATPRAGPVADAQTPTGTATPSPEATPTLAPSPTVAPSPTPIATPSPTPTRVGNLVVVQPASGQLVANPIRVQGMARAFEATIDVAVLVGGKQVAHSGVHTSTGAPEWGAFDAAIEADLPDGADPVDGEVRVMIPSAKGDGSGEAITIPVRIQPSNTQAPAPGTRYVKVYFENVVGDKISFFAVNRSIPWTLAVGRASLEALIKGPTATETLAGLRTCLPTGTKVRSLKITNGIAHADFDSTLLKGAQGSAATYGITQQIRLTLLQFPSVKDVVISVEGKTPSILGP